MLCPWSLPGSRYRSFSFDEARARLAGAGDRFLQLRLAHLRAAPDVEPTGLGLELLARGLVTAPHRGGLLPERAARRARQILQGLLASSTLLRLLDVAPGGAALFRRGHAREVPGEHRANALHALPWNTLGVAESELVERAAEDLYGVPPGEFTHARDERAKELRREGERDAANAVKALRRPTVAAWALNQLTRRRRKDLDALLSAGEDLRAAQEELLA